MTEQNSIQNHPEAELLVAFAEHSLTPHERESVLMHLADCAECREILFVAQFGLPEEPSAEIVVPSQTSRANWFTWRPITVAACLLLTVGVLTQQIYQRTHSTNQTEAKNTPAPLPPGAVGNLAKNIPIPPANVPAAHAPEPMSAASPNAIAAPVAPQKEAAMNTVTPEFKASAPPLALIGSEHPLTSSESVSLHQMQQAHAAEMHSQQADMHLTQSSAADASIKEASASQASPAKMEAYSAPTTSSGFSANYEPRAAASANGGSWDRSAMNSKGVSANTYAITRPATLPSGQIMRDSVVLNGRKLALDQDGRLYSSIDQGASWREIHKQWSGTATMLMLAPQSASADSGKGAEVSGDAVMLLNSANAAWISSDGGESWKPASKKN